MFEELKEFSDEELQEELNRRANLKSQPWPREIELECELDVVNSDPLEEATGFDEGSAEFDQALSPLVNLKITLEVGSGGESKIVAVDGRSVVD